MEKYQGAFLIIAVCGIILLILGIKSNSHMILNIIIRSVTGSLFIFFINRILENGDIFISVGLNPLTVLTSGILGFPGVLLLFGIKLYCML